MTFFTDIFRLMNSPRTFLRPMTHVVLLTAWWNLASCLAHAEEAKSKAIKPDKVISLMADPTFSDFTVFLNADKSLTNKREEIWRIEDGKLHVIGKAFGYIRTNKPYRDYHLFLEYKWGEKTWKPRVDRARDCGLLVHGHGEDGALGGTWMASIEAQLIEGGSGDILVLQGKRPNGELITTRLTCEVTKDRDGETVWKKGGKAMVFPEEGKQNQRINWRDRDPDWKDVKGFRGAKDIERPLGEWNLMEVIAQGDTLKIYINGELVNEGRGAEPSEGYICLQTEAAECWIRRFELWPLGSSRGTKPSK